MLYNGVELPDIDNVWTDKAKYQFAYLVKSNATKYTLILSDKKAFVVGSWGQIVDSGYYSIYSCSSPYLDWTTIIIDGSHGASYTVDNAANFLWSNVDIYVSGSNNIYLSGTVSVDPNAPVGIMTHYATNFGSDHSHTTFEVDGLSVSDTYFIRGYCYQESSLIATVDSPSWTGSGTYCTVEFSGLLPSTTYDFEYVLYVNDEETSVTYTNSVTTLDASSGGDDSGGGGGTGDGGGASGGCTECPSILSSILSAIANQSTFFADWKQAWTSRMDSLEDAVVSAISALAPVPDPTETALKESANDATKEVTDSLFAEDAPTKVTASDVKDVAEIGAAASSMFDSGVSISSFFDALNNIRFIAFFSQETYDDLNTVQSISTYSRDNESGYVDYYSENLDKIQKFVGGE